jgi:O-methyltransferase involved in polyketide biosynthesis
LPGKSPVAPVRLILPRHGTTTLGPLWEGGGALEPFDPTKPNIARVYDYWLGGKDNFAPDRDLAERLLEIYPLAAQVAQENRQFLGRAIAQVTRQGITQFIDVGAGLPTVLNTHDVAQHAEPAAKVAYVDNDPVVISHACAILAHDTGVVVVPGDMRDPAAILADPALNSEIDIGRPVGLMLAGVLHFLPAGDAREVVGAFAERIAPGSYVIISVGTGQPDLAERFSQAYTASSLYLHRRDEIVRLFDGLELVPPGLVEARAWADGPAGPPPPPPLSREGTFLAAVARKPGSS